MILCLYIETVGTEGTSENIIKTLILNTPYFKGAYDASEHLIFEDLKTLEEIEGYFEGK